MELKIYSKQGDVKLTAAPDDNGSASCGIQEESVLSLSFTAFACVAVEVYDYVDFEGVRYWALERYRPRMNARKEWTYSVKFYGAESLGKQALMVNPTDGLDDPIVTLTAPAREHAALIVANLNRITGTTDWKVGEVNVTANITLEYTGKYVSDALSELAAAADTEWWFDGLTLNICRCEYGEVIDLAYGDALLGGLNITTADGVKFFTRLFPVGSSRNIDPDRYGAARLQLPGGVKYVEQETELGIVEHFEQEAFADIYPRRVGTVGSVRSRDVQDDNGEPYTIWYFTDPDLPFDPNEYELGGLVKQVTFQSGELRGRDFEVNYNSETHEFEIITQWPYDDDMQLPSPPLVPATGDQYVLWNIRMPDSYYPAAEQEYLDAVNEFMSENRKDTTVITAPTDYTVINRRRLELKPGQRVRLLSDEYFVGGYRDTRIISVVCSINCPGSMTLRMSDVLSTGRITRIEEQITQVGQLTRQVSSEFPDIIRSWENTPAADTNLYSARKSEREFLNRRRGGTVEGPVSFRDDVAVAGALRTGRDILAAGPITVGDYAAGMTGTGGRIDPTGAAELDSLSLRRFLEVPQLNYNRVDLSVGDAWSAPGGGVIEQVDTQQQLITLRLEEGEIGSARAGDICMGIFHSQESGQNAAEDSDDSRGNRRFAGFATVYFQVTEVSGERNETLHYERRPVSQNYAQALDPFEAMTFVCYGSFTDPERRTSRYSTRTYQRYLKDVSDWEFTVHNIAAQFGDLSNLSLFGLNMSGYSAYLDNVYMQGVLQSLDGMFRLDALRKQLLIAGESGTGIAFDPARGLIIGEVYDPESGRFVTEYDLSEIDRMKDTLAQMNDDTIFDIVEKQQMRIQWETINGAASVSSMGQSGSYYHALQIAAAAEGLRVFATADGEVFLVRTGPQTEQYGQILLRNDSASATTLTQAYLALRDYLAEMRLYDDAMSEGFDPRRLATLFTAYYDAVDAIYKGLSDAARQTANEALNKANSSACNFTNEEIDPPADMKAGDTWTPTDADGNTLGYTLTYIPTHDGFGWVITGDNTATTIDKGLITTGTIQLGDSGDAAKVKAGMTGAGTTDESIRIWAGSEKNSMSGAPFRVTQGGKLYAKNAEIEGKITAKEGSIGSIKISENQIGIEGFWDDEAGTYRGGAIITPEFVEYVTRYTKVSFGLNTVPAVLGFNIPALIQNTAPNALDDTAYGMLIDVKGARVNNIAMYIPNGAIHGVRHNFRTLDNTYWAYELTEFDYDVAVNASDVTVKLPASPQKGQVYRIWKHATGNLTIQSQGPKIIPLGESTSGTTYSVPFDNHSLFEIVYSGVDYILKQYT